MSDDAVRDLLVRGIAAAKAGDKNEARYYLEWALRREDIDRENEIRARVLLSDVLDAPAARREQLESALALDLFNAEARRKLAILDGHLAPEDIINPDTFAAGEAVGPALCPDCGAALVFAPDGRSRICERCRWTPERATVVQQAPDVLLAQGLAAAKAGQQAEARASLEALTRHPAAAPELRIQGWLWLSGVVASNAEKRHCLEEVLRLQPTHAVARKGLAHLARLTPEREPAALAGSSAAPAQRFVCTQCGGKMVFEAGNKWLACAYCGQRQTVFQAMQAGALVQEHDFVVALATAQGHSHPVEMQSFKCQGCGATFLVGPGVLSLACSYCGSAHVLALPPQVLNPPEGIIPFGISEDTARQLCKAWSAQKIPKGATLATSLAGMYLPVWTFDIGGTLAWSCRVTVRQGRSSTSYVRSGEDILDFDDLLVLGGRTLPVELWEALSDFDLKAVAPYEPAYLADWPAEVYSIAASDASLAARERAVKQSRRKLELKLRAMAAYNESISDIQANTQNLLVYAFKLLLLPVWLTHYQYEAQIYHVVLNGQTGQVRAQLPPSGFKKLLGELFGK